jgi:CII-binding regulator of phage lambda lysogenization HflD
MHLTPFQVKSVCDLPDIYAYLCFKVFKDDLVKQPATLISILEQLSFINIKSEEIIPAFCNVLQSKNINNFEAFIEQSSANARVARKTSIFRYNPKSILSVFVNHENLEEALYFIRYVMHSQHLPEMESFLHRYNNADYGLRDALIPKVIYSWHYIE